MAVTDLSGVSDLPWWARQGPGPTGGPAATPSGAAPGVSQAQWLQYLQQMFGIGSAQVGEAPDPNSDAVRAAAIAAAKNAPANAWNKDDYGAGSIPVTAASVPPIQPPAAQGGPGAGLSAPAYANPFLAAGVGPGAGLNAGTPMQPPAAAAPPQFMPWRGPMAGDSPANIAAAGGDGGATAAGATSNPRFIGIDRPNAPAEVGALGRNSGLQGTALNLAGLFGRQQPQAAPAAPVAVPGPMARPDLAQRVPLANAPMPPVMPPEIAAARAGRGPMSPDALARAVRRPNWWMNA